MKATDILVFVSIVTSQNIVYLKYHNHKYYLYLSLFFARSNIFSEYLYYFIFGIFPSVLWKNYQILSVVVLPLPNFQSFELYDFGDLSSLNRSVTAANSLNLSDVIEKYKNEEHTVLTCKRRILSLKEYYVQRDTT